MFIAGGDQSRSLTMLAYALADQHRWNVVWGHRGPCIDVKLRTIYLPASWQIGSPTDAKLFLGLFHHEVLGHGLSTDPDLPLKPPGVSELEAALRNTLEDIRIERAASARYLGVALALAETVAEMKTRKMWQLPSDNPGALIVMGTNHILRSEQLAGQGMALRDYAKQWDAYGEQVFGPLWQRILKIVRGVSKTRLDTLGTQETNALAADVIALLKQAQQNPQQASQPEQQPGEGQPDDGQPSGGQAGAGGSGDGTGQPKDPSQGGPAPGNQGGQPADGESSGGQAGAGGSGQATGQPKDSSQGEPSGTTQGAGQSSPPGAQNTEPAQPHGANASPKQEGQAGGNQGPGQAQAGSTDQPPIDPEQLAQAIADALSSAPKSPELTTMIAQSLNATLKSGGGAGGGLCNLVPRVKQPYGAQFQTAAGVLARTSAVGIDKLLEAQVTEHSWHTVTGRRIDRKRLPRIALGDVRVFARRRKAEGVSTCVLMAIDDSGSMHCAAPGWEHNDKTFASLAKAVGFAFGQVFERYDASWALAEFATNVSVYKDFDDSRVMARNFRPGEVGGGTVTSGALLHLLPHVARRPEDKKLIIVVTDGMPSNEDLTIAAIEECYRYGVQVMTLLLGSDGVTYERKLRLRGLPVGRATTAEKFREAVTDVVARAALLGLDLRAAKRKAA